MTVRYVADLDLVADHVARAQGFATDVAQAVAGLDDLVARLHLTWTGRAAEAHATAHADWVGGATTMREALAELAAVAEHARGCYALAADANLRMWAPLA